MALYDRIVGLCKDRGIKGGKMCQDLGMSKSLMTDLKMGRSSGISLTTAHKIASYFGVSVEYLLGEDNPPQQTEEKTCVKTAERLVEILKDEEYVEMFADFHSLDEKKRRIIIDLVHNLAEA